MPTYQSVFITSAVTASWEYAYTTPNYDATLGHSLWTGIVPGKPLVFGYNGKKPNRVIKSLVGGKSKSTFVDAGKEDDAKTAGWKVTVSTSKRPPSGKNTKRVAIKLQAGIFHCWNMPKVLHTALGATGLADLGIVDASAQPADNLIWGAQGYVLTQEAGGIPAGTRFNIRRFRVSYADATGKKHMTFAAPDSPHMTGA